MVVQLVIHQEHVYPVVVEKQPLVVHVNIRLRLLVLRIVVTQVVALLQKPEVIQHLPVVVLSVLLPAVMVVVVVQVVVLLVAAVDALVVDADKVLG